MAADEDRRWRAEFEDDPCSRAVRYCVPPIQLGSKLIAMWWAMRPSPTTLYGPE